MINLVDNSYNLSKYLCYDVANYMCDTSDIESVKRFASIVLFSHTSPRTPHYPQYNVILKKLIERKDFFKSFKHTENALCIAIKYMKIVGNDIRCLNIPYKYLSANMDDDADISYLESRLVEILKLCPNLKTLTIDGDSFNQILPSLPQNLQILNIGFLCGDQFKLLPESLTSLKFKSNNNISESDLEKLPGNLKSFSWTIASSPYVSSSIPYKTLTLLPQSIEDLQLKCARRLRLPDLTKLSPNLKTLDLQADNIHINHNTIEGLKGLVSLKLTGNSNISCSNWYEKLPASLLHLSLSSNYPVEYFRTLPRDLQTLSIKIDEVISVEDISVLPPRLIELCISDQGLNGDITLMGFPLTLERLSIFRINNLTLGALPPNLIYLKTKVRDGKAESVQLLPKKLQYLKVSRMDNLTDESVQFFPSSLHTLIIKHTSHLTNKAFQYLPRGLSKLELPETNFTFSSEDLSFLPIRLKVFKINNNLLDLEENQINRLPPMVISQIVQDKLRLNK